MLIVRKQKWIMSGRWNFNVHSSHPNMHVNDNAVAGSPTGSIHLFKRNKTRMYHRICLTGISLPCQQANLASSET